MEGELWGLAVHPTRQVIVTASDDNTVRLWDLESHTLYGILNIGRAARCAAFSIDGKAIAVGLKDGKRKRERERETEREEEREKGGERERMRENERERERE